MTTSQIIACAIAWTAAVVAITMLVLMKRRSEAVARYDVRWQDKGGEFTARGLSEKEFDTLMARLKSEEKPDA